LLEELAFDNSSSAFDASVLSIEDGELVIIVVVVVVGISVDEAIKESNGTVHMSKP
jgi:hypothetical protein